jgi:glutamate formiminotransferase/formiminotetrahydrofolate cyclodeaminase
VQIVECVPNFSEGRDPAVLDAIADAIRAVDGVTLLDVDPGAATNRTVFTFVGAPAAVEEAAFQAIKRAGELIDMSKHSGEHARMGATDVCPFVPVAGVTMEDCVAIAHRLGKRVGNELAIPGYYYEHAATSDERRNLANVRKGEYEGLARKLADPRWKPDFGPATFDARRGATAISAREFLIAYNVNLNSKNRDLAHDIALDVREQGRFARDAEGKIARDADGNALRTPGVFQHVKGVGWYIDEYARAQVSMNLTNHQVSPVHVVFDDIEARATNKGLRVTGSEIVGLIPLDAMRAAGRHYLEKQGESTGVPDARLVEVAIQSLGLDDLGPFDPHEKIIEWKIRAPRPLVEMTVEDFTLELASDSPAPGGGSVAALCGALSAALSTMVAHLTYDKKGMEDLRPKMNDLAQRGECLRVGFVHAIDADTDAFNAIITARRMPKKSAEDRAARETAIVEANQEATRVPLGVLTESLAAVTLAGEVASAGNPASLSDAGVAALTALSCAEGAYYNVLINLAGEASEFATETLGTARAAIADVRRVATDVARAVEARLEGELA